MPCSRLGYCHQALLSTLESVSLMPDTQLSSTFYDQTCPNALRAIRTSIRQSISRERRMAASLIRLHFHDCFVQGCDASILLDKAATPTSERSAASNVSSVRGFELIDAAKSEVEKICTRVVSCEDILAVAASDTSIYVGGPSWAVKLGRRDSTSASRRLAESDLPRFTYNLDQLISNFARKGLSVRDMVALSGNKDHTPSAMHDASHFAIGYMTMGATLMLVLLVADAVTAPLLRIMEMKKGLLQSDRVLFNGGSTDSIVSEYSKNPSVFQSDFASALIKMGDIKPLTGQHGVIRRICSALN
ncbi:hypothetical protein TEA_001097 [Camellia sinensis var. sinensis]|uniref:Peroxidase n=1 Tax=Camellia sinensis var. sinensis TaxID=542762 RepID=A0A4S4DDD0_CAMSN|nr:hypothetical protein TEA_001097 [Camellia sinensis var. sinensis]